VSREYGFETVTFMLSGSVYVVTNPNEHADLHVKVVNDPGIAVLYVYRTNRDDFDCGIWRFVKNRRDAKFTVRFVKKYEQIAIYYVSSPKEAGSRY
jgi:hypothetical protein